MKMKEKLTCGPRDAVDNVSWTALFFFVFLIVRPTSITCTIRYCPVVVMALVVTWRPGVNVGKWLS
jgi:hypothetical protein